MVVVPFRPRVDTGLGSNEAVRQTLRAPSIAPDDRAHSATRGRQTELKPVVSRYRPQDETSPDEPDARYLMARAFEGAVRAALIVPFVLIFSVVLVFAILPLHSSFRWDNLSDSYG